MEELRSNLEKLRRTRNTSQPPPLEKCRDLTRCRLCEFIDRFHDTWTKVIEDCFQKGELTSVADSMDRDTSITLCLRAHSIVATGD